MRTANCTSCGAKIVWTITKTGARMPLDAAALDPDGYSGATGSIFAQLARPDGHVLALAVGDITGALKLWQTRALAGRLSHFATCPHAAQHRRSSTT